MRWGRFVPLAASVLVGGLVALQSRINGELSRSIGSGLEAAFVSFGSGLLIVGVVVAVSPALRAGLARVAYAVRSGELAWWQILGGILGGFFVAVQSATVPVVGVAVFTVAVVAGQSSNSLLVDRIDLGSSGRQPITLQRAIAAAVAVAAVALAVSDRFVEGSIPPAAVGFAFVAGLGSAVQQAINGRVARAGESPMSATVLNFMFGTLALAAAVGVSWGVTDLGPSPLPSGPWWIYLGGVIGIAFIAIAAWVVQIVGVLFFALLSIAGQLSGALLLDVFAPTAGTRLGWNLVVGVLLAFVAVAVAARGRGSTAPAPMRESGS